MGIPLFGQGGRTFSCLIQPITGHGKCTTFTFFISRKVLLQTLHHLFAVERRLDVFEMQ